MYDSPDSLAQRNLIILNNLNKNDDTRENSKMLSDTDNFITTILIQVTEERYLKWKGNIAMRDSIQETVTCLTSAMQWKQTLYVFEF